MTEKNLTIAILIILFLFLYAAPPQEIHQAVQKGDLEWVKRLLGSDPSLLELENDAGNRPLHLAVMTGNEEMVKYLLARGADIDARGEQEAVPLHWALAFGHTGIAEYLIEQGCDLEAKATGGATTLAFTVLGRQTKKVETQLDLVERLVKAGLDVNEVLEGDMTLLHGTSILGDPEMAEKLVGLGAEVNARTANGETPLFLTAVRGRFETAERFLRLGAEPDLRQKKTGRTPMHMAALKGYSDIIGLLIEHGAKVQVKDEAGMTPVEYAAKYRNKKVVERLIAAGAQADGFEAKYAGPSYLSLPLESGEAAVWYCGQSGWAVRTRNHFLVFDYIPGGRCSDDPCLANGRIHPAEIQGQNLSVFVTHAHNDHYDPVIFDWSKAIEGADYYLGQPPASVPGKVADPPEYVLLEPRVRKKMDGVDIATIKSTDGGVGIVVRVDGLTIYHAGDHANRTKELEAAFTEEIDYLAGRALSIDMAFVPITGCGFRDPEAVEKGTYYFLEKISPKVMFPMHGADNEYLYTEFAQKAEKRDLSTYFCCAENRGDHFLYSEDRIK